MDDLRVQTIAPDEVDACAAAYAAAYAQPPWDEVYERGQVAGYLRSFMGRDGFCAWRLSVGGAVAGVALGIVVPCPDGAFLRLEDFCVAPKWQRRGLGGAFLAEIERLSAALGCDSVLLATQHDVPAHDFYLKQGFREVPTAYMYYMYKEENTMEYRDPNCAYCVHGEPLAQFGIYICDLNESKLYLFKEQSHPGRVIVASKRHVGDLTDLTDAERDGFFADVAHVSRALQAAFKPDKVNYGAYNDNGGHLHFHLVPKYRNEYEWGGVFAMNPGLVKRTDAEYDALIEQIKAAL